jgi:hypothetical protein
MAELISGMHLWSCFSVKICFRIRCNKVSTYPNIMRVVFNSSINAGYQSNKHVVLLPSCRTLRSLLMYDVSNIKVSFLIVVGSICVPKTRPYTTKDESANQQAGRWTSNQVSSSITNLSPRAKPWQLLAVQPQRRQACSYPLSNPYYT